jgi:hypothetical protein
VMPFEDSDMSTKDVHAAFPARNFHPEFGYLCPSAQMRRKLRSAAVTFLAGMVIAAGTALALVPQLVPVGDRMPEVPALALALAVATRVPPVDKPADGRAADGKTADVRAADEGMAVTMAPMRRMTDRFVRPRAQTSCDDLSGSFLAPQCRFGKGGKPRLTRLARAEAGHRVANISLGRAGAGLEGDQHGVPRSAPAAEAPAAAVTVVAANEPAPVPPPAKPAKKRVKMAPKPAPGRDIASADSVASAPVPGFDLFGLFHDHSRAGNGGTGNGNWAMTW